MIYGQFQYYNEELESWIRTIEFHKIELRTSLAHIGLLLEQPMISSANAKGIGAFTDQFMVQEQQLDHNLHQVNSQIQRLTRALSFHGTPVDTSLSHHQDLLRSKMKLCERTFMNTKYNCSIYLSSLLSETVSLQRL